ncbi:MAG: phage holin family protein [Bacteroidota bacterium]|nr:phage holin family protein [Bacteroidota bacterium]
MQPEHNHFETLFVKARDYAETRAELVKLKVADKTSETASEAVSVIAGLVLLLVFVLLLSVGLALLAGEWLGKTYYGFFAVSGLYGIIGLIVKANSGRLIKAPVSDFIVGKFFNASEKKAES